jgi:hypothetical protein
MKNITKILMSMLVAMPLLVSQDVSAREIKSNHYQRNNNQKKVVKSNHYQRRPNNAVGPRTTYTTRHRVVQPRVIHRHVHTRPVVTHRHVHYRPYYRPVVAHYHPGFFDPCYDDFHTDGVYWNVNAGTGGFGIGVQSGW